MRALNISYIRVFLNRWIPCGLFRALIYGYLWLTLCVYLVHWTFLPFSLFCGNTSNWEFSSLPFLLNRLFWTRPPIRSYSSSLEYHSLFSYGSTPPSVFSAIPFRSHESASPLPPFVKRAPLLCQVDIRSWHLARRSPTENPSVFPSLPLQAFYRPHLFRLPP